MPRFFNSNERTPRAAASRVMVLALLTLLLVVTACSKGPSEHPAPAAVTPEAATENTAVHAGTMKGTTLQGLLWTDHDGDGRFGAADTVLPETKLFLDLNGNGVPDDFEPVAVTDRVGQYRFSNLVPGISYTLSRSGDGGFSALALEAAGQQNVRHFTWQ